MSLLEKGAGVKMASLEKWAGAKDSVFHRSGSSAVWSVLDNTSGLLVALWQSDQNPDRSRARAADRFIPELFVKIV